MGYLDVQYSEARQPRTTFPDRLIEHLLRLPRVGLERMAGGTVADFGAGRGDFSRAWEDAVGCIVYQVDRDGSPDIRVDFNTSAFVGLGTGTMDVVFSKSLIEHLWDPTNMLGEAYRVLKPGGRLIILCPDWRTYMHTFYDDYTHVRPYDVVSLKDVIEASGFKAVSCSRIYQYPAIWRWPALGVVATLWRWLTPVGFSLWLSRKSGISFFRWASQLTLLAVATK